MADQTGTMTRSGYTIFTIGTSNPAICRLQSLLAGAPKSPLDALFSLGKTGAANGGKDKPA